MENKYTERVELHCHTNKSEGYGTSSVQEILKFVKEQGMPAVAFSDYGNVIAYPEIQEFTKRRYAEIKPIYGIELLVADDLLPREAVKGRVFMKGLPANYVLILVKNEVGLHNLYKLLSTANLQQENRVPWLTWNQLMAHREGLLIGSGSSVGELQCAVFRSCDETVIKEIARRFDFLEIQPMGTDIHRLNADGLSGNAEKKELQKIRDAIVALGEVLKIPVVATSDSHYLREENELGWRVLLNKTERNKEMEDKVYFRTTEEMLQEFAYLGEKKAYEVVVKNSNRILELIELICPIRNEKRTVYFPDADSQLRFLCENRVNKLWGNHEEEFPYAKAKLEKELTLIAKNGFAPIYLHYQDIILRNRLKSSQYVISGEAASSIVCYLLGISNANPLDTEVPLYDMFFSGYEGEKEPRIKLLVDETVQNQALNSLGDLAGVQTSIRTTHHYVYSDSVVEDLIQKYEKDNACKLSEEKRNQVELELQGCLYRKGVPHTGCHLLIPTGVEVTDYFPLDRDCTGEQIVAHFAGTSINHQFINYYVAENKRCTLLAHLHNLTNMYPSNEEIRNREYLDMVGRWTEEPSELRLEALCDVEREFQEIKRLISECNPATFADFVKMKAMTLGKGVWEYNGQDLMHTGKKLSELITTPEDIYEMLVCYGVDEKTSYTLAENIGKGRMYYGKRTWRIEAIDEMRKWRIPEWVIDSCSKIKYLCTRAHAVEAVMLDLRLLYYRCYFPIEFLCAGLVQKKIGRVG